MAGAQVRYRDGEHEAIPNGNGVAKDRPERADPADQDRQADRQPHHREANSQEDGPVGLRRCRLLEAGRMQAAHSASVSGMAAPQRTQACESAGAAGLSAPESVLGASLTSPIFPRAAPERPRASRRGRQPGAEGGSAAQRQLSRSRPHPPGGPRRPSCWLRARLHRRRLPTMPRPPRPDPPPRGCQRATRSAAGEGGEPRCLNRARPEAASAST